MLFFNPTSTCSMTRFDEGYDKAVLQLKKQSAPRKSHDLRRLRRRRYHGGCCFTYKYLKINASIQNITSRTDTRKATEFPSGYRLCGPQRIILMIVTDCGGVKAVKVRYAKSKAWMSSSVTITRAMNFRMPLRPRPATKDCHYPYRWLSGCGSVSNWHRHIA